MSPVNVEEIKKAIGDQREETDEKRRGTQIGERDVPKGDCVPISPNILAMRGVRRCGKKTFSLLLMKEEFGHLNLDGERLYRMEAKVWTFLNANSFMSESLNGKHKLYNRKDL